MLRIGVFSQVTRISVRMLRYYQDYGLLVPVWVDPDSGYRYYGSEQLETARLVTGLREAGFSVEASRDVLSARDDPARVRTLMDDQRKRLEAERGELSRRVAAFVHMSSMIKEHPMEFTVETRTLPAMTVATLRDTIGSYPEEGRLWEAMMPLTVRSAATFPAGGLAGATFYDEGYRESDVDVELWVQVAAPFTPVAPLRCVEVPEREIVCATLRGDYTLTAQVMASLGAYIAEHTLNTGPMFNIYRVGPGQNPDPSTWVTDICLPIVAD
ncbi:MerR family transcriptional regulator [Klugiella xanthotipulae]